MNTKALKQKILDLAIHGKLLPLEKVEKIRKEEPASGLLEKIRAEKQEKIAKGELKKDKNDSFIFVGDDKRHYEKFVDGSVKDIEDEIPFELPDGWSWCRLGKYLDIRDGTHDSPKYVENGVPFVTSKNLVNGKIDFSDVKYISEIDHNNFIQRSFVEDGDILFAMIGSIGNPVLIKKDREFSIKNVALFKPNNRQNTNMIYVYYYLSWLQDSLRKQTKGGMQPFIPLNLFRNELFIPLPPLAEQQLIVAEIEKIFAQIDLLEQNKTDLQTAIKQAKSKILDLAIHGKLVPQDSNDEPASVLLEKIRAEKEEKIAKGELKRDKNDSYIYKSTTDNCHYQKNADGSIINVEDEIPFDIPEGWSWVRLNELADIARGGSPRPIENFITNDENGINWIKIGDTAPDSKYITSAKEKIIPEGKNRSRFVHAGDFLLTNSMSFGRPYILKIDGCIHDGWLVFADIKKCLYKDFLYYALSSLYIYNAFSLVAAGSTVKNLKSDTVKQVLFPLPPLTEQTRIVAKIEELFTLLDNIQNNLI